LVPSSEGLAELGYGWAYRVLDAQYVRVDGLERAVPQRRRRVFVVGHLGDWRRAAAVLFERESLFWDSAPRREARERVAPTIAARTRGGGGLGTDFDCDGGLIAEVGSTLNAHYGDKWGLEDQHINQGAPLFVAHSLRADGFNATEDVTGRGTPLVAHPLTAGMSASAARMPHEQGALVAFSSKDHGADAGETAPTLRAMGHDGSHANAGGQVAVAFAQAAQGESHADAEETDTSALLRRVREAIGAEALSQWGLGILDQLGYTGIPYRGKPAADGPRYKALGNSMAVNVVRWLGQRIYLVETAVQSNRAAA
jgi:DNA (cytosine-5)-methyltransferase 1